MSTVYHLERLHGFCCVLENNLVDSCMVPECSMATHATQVSLLETRVLEKHV